MQLKVYQENAIKTIKYMGSIQFDMAHMCLGLCSELNELSDAIESGDAVNVAEELADIMWYAANHSTIRQIAIDRAANASENMYSYKDIVYAVSKFSDASKKYIIYNDPKKEQLEIKWLNKLVEICYNFYVDGQRVDLETALDRNIAKLLGVRYKNGYSDAAAQNRDTVAERKALENGSTSSN